jgi:hypothetical protein
MSSMDFWRTRSRARHVGRDVGTASCFVDAKRHLTSKGVFNGGKRPYGFDIVQDGDVQRMVPNATEQVIERMKAMRAEGATYRTIGAEVGKGHKQRILERMERTA